MILLKLTKYNTYKENNIKNFIKDYKSRTNYGILICPACGSCKLIRWGCYERNIIYIDNNCFVEEKLKIQRVYCKSCKTTHSLLPEGIIPYKQFSLDSIIEVLSNPYSNDINDAINTSYLICFETIKRWQKQFKMFFPYLVTMFKTRVKKDILKNIKANILNFFESFYKINHRCFLQIKLLPLNMCPL